jgi:hypothetical protein
MAKKPADLDALRSERLKLEAQLEDVRKRERAAETLVRDAGRATLLAALDRVKIAAMDRTQASAIAEALATHGGAKVAVALASLTA